MSDSKKSIDRKLSSLSRFGLRGRGSSSSSRLPSLKPARDLSLGGPPKRVFTPNIVGRSNKKEESTTVDADLQRFRHLRGDPRNRGRNRGRGRGRGEVISSTGIFSQGPAAQQTLARAFGGGGGSTSNLKRELCKGKQEDEMETNKVLQLLSEDGNISFDVSDGLVPITLPLTSKMMQDIKTETKDAMLQKHKTEEKHSECQKPKVVKTVKSESQTVNSEKEIADLFSEDAPNGQLFFLQFPDTLPIKPISEDNQIKNDQDKTSVEENLNNHLKRFTFQNVSEGYIGKLQVHKSGKVKMLLGNVGLNVTLGTPCGFLQDLISVHGEVESADMICLGHVKHRLIASPDYETLLGSV